jgi:predicted sugar kinase
MVHVPYRGGAPAVADLVGFGGIGLAISGLGTRLTIERASTSEAFGPDADRVSQHSQKIERLLSLRGGHRIRVSEVVPAHAGLGSGTQLALAVAAGLRSLHNLPLDIAGDAGLDGARSGIGIGLFRIAGSSSTAAAAMRRRSLRSFAVCLFRRIGASW